MLQNLLALSCGAVLGALTRFTITHFSSELSNHHGFPYGTLIVNVVGSFLAGFILIYTTRTGHDDLIRLALVTGFCGAFTTFSAFAYESVEYLRAGATAPLLLNVLANNVLSLGAAFVGIIAAQRRA
jgi:fluoride exporter